MTAPKQKIIGAILAGGQSSRMGQDKALLPLDINRSRTDTLLNYMISKLQALPMLDDVIVCRNETGFLQDITPGLGPLGALYTLSQHYPDYLALIIPVDMPLLEIQLLEELLEQSKETDSALYFEGYYFPLTLHLTKQLNQQLENRFNQTDSDLSIAQLLRNIGARKIVTNRDKLLFTNINTPEEWSALTRTKESLID